MSNAYEIVKKARSSNRLRAKEVIERLLEDIVYLKETDASGTPRQ